MTERLLQFIWQFQYFNKNELRLDQGETLTIVHPGIYNTHQGPDFSDAKIVINNTMWAGNIEIHTKSSDWHRHGHTGDKNYSNIILHVVWENDNPINFESGSAIPTLSLRSLVPKLLLDRYKELMKREEFVPCETFLPLMDSMKWTSWKERLAIERLQRKSADILTLFDKANNHWEEVLWWTLARNFGVKINADIFERIAQTLPLNLLAKHKNQIHQLEGFLLGQAGLLDQTFQDAYPKLLQKEYNFYKRKYGLETTNVKPFFLRMRPANFPTIRLAQLAMLIYRSSHLFSKIKETDSICTIKELLDVTANDYWHYHYMLDEPTAFLPKKLGLQMVENIVINSIVPVIFAYGILNKDILAKEKALSWLTELSAEKNTVTQHWKTFGVTNQNALESQSLLELKQQYCDKRRCLDCAVGNAFLRSQRN